MRIAVFETEEWEHAGCLQLRPAHEVICTTAALTPETAADFADAEVISPFVNSRLSVETLRAFAELRLVVTRSTGYDHIDLDYCRAHAITVCNVPSYGDNTVAEHTFALMLAVARRLVEAANSARQGRFDSHGLRGFDLRGRRLGVIGTGRIGARVIELGKAFGMHVVAYDSVPKENLSANLGFDYIPLTELLATADVITLHVPATSDTAHMLSSREFGLMKPGAVLINTARGGVVDVVALVQALTEGRLRGAGLDVLPNEPLLRDEAQVFRQEGLGIEMRSLLASHVLLQMPQVVVTPHNAFNTDDAVARLIGVTIENINAFDSGRAINVVA